MNNNMRICGQFVSDMEWNRLSDLQRIELEVFGMQFRKTSGILEKDILADNVAQIIYGKKEEGTNIGSNIDEGSEPSQPVVPDSL